MTPLEKLEATWKLLTAQLETSPTPQLFGNAVNLIRLQHLIETGKEPEGSGDFDPEKLLTGGS